MKFIASIFLFFLLTGITVAQKLTATTNKNHVATGEPFQIQYTVNSTGSGFTGPNLSDFNVLSGPNGSQSVQIINGSMSQSNSWSYYISAKKEGKYTIGPASVTSGGKKLESNSMNIDVSKSAYPPGTQQNGTAGQTQNDADKLFIKTSLSKTKVYQGEQVTLVYKVFTRINLVGFQNAKMPSYTGFWSQDIPNPANYTVGKETLNGLQYSVVEFKKTFLFAQRSGTLEIEPVEIDCVVRQQSAARSQDPWSFFGPTQEDVQVKLKGQTIKIEVLPLPETGKPDGFAGAVGQFNLKALMNKDKVKTNEAVNINVSVTGKGNVNLIEPPKLVIPPDIESYDPKPTENISVTAEGVSGSKANEYVLIPRYGGSYKVEAATFSYFDPGKQSYVTLRTPEFNIQVEKAPGDTTSASGAAALNNRKDVQQIGNDIRYIKTGKMELEETGHHFFGTLKFALGFILPSCCFLLFLLVRRKHIKDNSDVQLIRSRKATKMAHKRLTLAKTHLRNNQKEPFYAEISKALYGYLGDKLAMPISDLSKESIQAVLEQRGVSAETVQPLLKTIDACEFARYAPSSASGDLQGLYDQTIRLITKLEDEIKKGNKTVLMSASA